MVNIREIEDDAVTDMLEAHHNIGGVLEISVYEIADHDRCEMPDEYLAHLVTARHTLEQRNYTWNQHMNAVAAPGKRAALPYAQTDFDKLDNSGEKISVEHFMGPYFDLQNNKPLLCGRLTNKTVNAYYYFDQEEVVENEVNIKNIMGRFEASYPENKGNFVYALTEPPYGLSGSILEIGTHALHFIKLLFDEPEHIVIYAWDTQCSIVFEAGQEWWGSFFWTIYNPGKNWYIGITASTTD